MQVLLLFVPQSMSTKYVWTTFVKSMGPALCTHDRVMKSSELRSRKEHGTCTMHSQLCHDEQRVALKEDLSLQACQVGQLYTCQGWLRALYALFFWQGIAHV